MSRKASKTDDPEETADSAEAKAPHYAGHRQRLRARFIDAGAEALADYEMLELVLFTALPRRDVKPLAKQLIDQFGSLGAVVRAQPEQLRGQAGLTDTAVAAIRIIGVVAERMLREAVLDKPVLSNWQALLDYLAIALKYEPTEQLRLLFLDRRNCLIADEVQQRGTIDHAPIYPREVVKRALELDASALILVHNHPSGDPTPSKDDIEVTKKIKAALEPIRILLHDHVVVGRKGHLSFKSLGLI